MKHTRIYWDKIENNFASEHHLYEEEGPTRSQQMADKYATFLMSGCQDMTVFLRHKFQDYKYPAVLPWTRYPQQ